MPRDGAGRRSPMNGRLTAGGRMGLQDPVPMGDGGGSGHNLADPAGVVMPGAPIQERK